MDHRKELKTTSLNAFVLVFSGILSINSVILYNSFQDVAQQEKYFNQTAEVKSLLDLVLMETINGETGHRGFLLTHKTEFLDPYKQATIEANRHLATLHTLLTDPSDLKSLVDLDTEVKKRFAIFDRSIAAALERSGDASQNGNIVIPSSVILAMEQGKRSMDVIRSQTAQMRGHQDQLSEDRREDAQGSQRIFLLALALTTLLSLIVVAWAYKKLRQVHLDSLARTAQKTHESWKKSKTASLMQEAQDEKGLSTVSQSVLNQMATLAESLTGNLYVIDEFGHLKCLARFAPMDPTPRDLRESGNDSNWDQHVGLVGETLRQSEPKFFQNLPKSYLQVKSSLGSATTTSLTLIPLYYQNRAVGIVELGSFSEVSPAAKEVLSELSVAAAQVVQAARSRDQLQNLLEKTQQQAIELQAQQEELRTNNEELEQQARALESQQEYMNLKNRELEQARRDLEGKAQALTQTSHYKSEFLAKMSHELRTPLNSLLILASLLTENKSGNLTDQQREFARSIHSAGSDLLNLINDILDLSKIEARKMALRPETFSVRSLLDGLVSSFSAQAQAKNLSLNVDLADGNGNEILQTDRMRLEQILKNFLSNALKFTETGHITLSAKTPSGASKDPKIVISVEDTGIGVPEDKKDLIFEAFEQADTSVSRKFGGTGLGLTISRELASLLGGQIHLESHEGQGSRFSVTLPMSIKIERAESDFAEPTSPSSNRATGDRDESSWYSRSNLGENTSDLDGNSHGGLSTDRNYSPKQKAQAAAGPHTILIVEDDLEFRKAVAKSAQEHSFVTIEAESGEEALNILKKQTPNAILLDIKLPGMSGMTLLEMLKKDRNFRHIPIHIMSSLDYENTALRLGAIGYLEKPVALDDVHAVLANLEKQLAKKVKKLLVVEDDARQREALRELISGPDTEITMVERGEEALAAMNSQTFDCVILDLSLPDISGFQLVDRINSLKPPLPPLVIYTGKDLSRQEEEHLRKYSESIIIKGAKSPERLLDEVNLFLHRMEGLLPISQQNMLLQLRSQEKVFEGRTILVVDDDLRNIFAMTSALEGKGLQVRVARNGQEALDALEQNADIELVLMDIMMPVMDGFEAMRRIRKIPQFKALPVVALTAKAMKEDHERCIEAGANDYLPKPVDLNKLTSVLKVWLTPKGFFDA